MVSFRRLLLAGLFPEEPFMQPFRNTISKLKLRASYGQVGNANLKGRRFAYISTILDQWNDVPLIPLGVGRRLWT